MPPTKRRSTAAAARLSVTPPTPPPRRHRPTTQVQSPIVKPVTPNRKILRKNLSTSTCETPIKSPKLASQSPSKRKSLSAKISVSATANKTPIKSQSPKPAAESPSKRKSQRIKIATTVQTPIKSQSTKPTVESPSKPKSSRIKTATTNQTPNKSQSPKPVGELPSPLRRSGRIRKSPITYAQEVLSGSTFGKKSKHDKSSFVETPKTAKVSRKSIRKSELINEVKIKQEYDEEIEESNVQVKKAPKNSKVSVSKQSKDSSLKEDGQEHQEEFEDYADIMSPVPCREKQVDEIWKFLTRGVADKDSRFMYVSGVPGTGKTLVVREVISAMQKKSPNSFQYIFVNSLNLGVPDRIWNRMYKAFGLKSKKTSSQISSDAAFREVDKYLKSTHLPVILVVDELDQLLDKKQNILYRILEWANNNMCKLSFVAIFNTVNLPETGLVGRNVSRMGFARTVFAPYTFKELQEIVKSHLGQDKTLKLPNDALILLSKKVAGISGDARRAIEIAKRTLELIDFNKQTGIEAIQTAFKELFSSPHIQCLKQCSELQKAVIGQLATILKAQNTDETTKYHVVDGVRSAALFDGVDWSVDAVLAAINRLFTMRFVLIETGIPSIHGKIALNIALEDVNYALKINEGEN